MKKVQVKRLVYTNGRGISHIGALEYDGHLTDANILGSIHERGKTQWIGDSLWLVHAGIPMYHITVERFYYYQKRWFENIFDAVRRI